VVVLWTVDSTTNVENSEAFTFASCLQRAPPLLGEDASSGSPLLTIRSQVGEASMNDDDVEEPTSSVKPASLMSHVFIEHLHSYERRHATLRILVAAARGASSIFQVKKEKFVTWRV
jgi:hypothetical protein